MKNHHLEYLNVVLRHKWFVLLAGIRCRVPLWRLIIHDWQKFTPIEWRANVVRFGEYAQIKAENLPQGAKTLWSRGLHHHYARGPHHSQYWLLRDPDGFCRAIEMPEVYVREMVADWLAAGRTYHGEWDITDWLNSNFPECMHVATKVLAISILVDIGYTFEHRTGEFNKIIS